MAGRFVAVRGWERLGFARLGDYAIERLGVSARSLQDLSHVDGRLAELPEIEAAFVRAEITWTKTRLLARIATPTDEAHWLALARSVTARELAREVRAVDQRSLEAGALLTDEDGMPEDVREGVVLRCTPAVRAKWHRARQLARRVAGEPLPIWACMEAVAAEVASALPVDWDEGALAARRDAPDPRAACAPLLPSRPANGCAPHGPERARGCADQGAEPADPFDLDERLRHLMAREQRLEARMGPLLLALAETRLYRAHGFPNLETYSRERLGMSPRKARALLRVERAGRRSPALVAAFRAGHLSWVRVHALVPLAVAASASHPAASAWIVQWISWAGRVTVRRLEDDVERALIACEADPCSYPGPPGEQPEPESRSDRQTGAPATARPGTGETARPFFSAPRPVARFFRAVLCSVRRHLERVAPTEGSPTRRLPTEGEGLEAMFDHAIAVWSAPESRASRAHRVFARDGSRCTVPGCSSFRNLHDHHIVFRSAGGSDDLSNRTTLCAWHHLRGVHSGIVRCMGRAPGGLRFELGLREGQSPLAVYRSGDRLDESAAVNHASGSWLAGHRS